MADVVFVMPRMNFDKPIYKRMEIMPPMGLMYISAVLKREGITTKIIDAYARDYNLTDTIDHIRKENPKIVGISAYSDFIRGVVQLGEKLQNYEYITVIGGCHVTADADFIRRFPIFDIAIKKEGEYSFLAVAKQVLHQKINRGSFTREPVPLCGTVQGSAPQRNPEKKEAAAVPQEAGPPVAERPRNLTFGDQIPIENLDGLPMPDRDIDWGGYYSGGFSGSQKLTIHSSRGCPFQCIFCSKYSSSVRYHSPERIEEEVRYCSEKFKTKQFAFTDDNLLVNKKRFLDICTRIKRYKVTWGCLARADVVDEEIAENAKASGCVGMTIGVECGNEEIRNKVVKKNITNDEVFNSRRICDKYKLKAYYFFMAGFPQEHEKELNETAKMARQLKTVFFSASPPICYPHTEIYDRATREGKISQEAWDHIARGATEEIPIYYPNGFTRSQFLEYTKKMVYKYYLSVHYIPIAIAYALTSRQNFAAMMFYFKEFAVHLLKKYILKRESVSK